MVWSWARWPISGLERWGGADRRRDLCDRERAALCSPSLSAVMQVVIWVGQAHRGHGQIPVHGSVYDLGRENQKPFIPLAKTADRQVFQSGRGEYGHGCLSVTVWPVSYFMKIA